MPSTSSLVLQADGSLRHAAPKVKGKAAKKAAKRARSRALQGAIR